MSLELGLVTHLRADSSVSAIVSTRIHPNLIPQDSSLPCVVYQRLPGTRETDMNGPQPFTKVRFQIDSWHTSYEGVKALADAVRVSLNGVGIASPRLLGAQSVQLIELESDQDIPSFEGDELEYRVSQDWVITYLEA